MLPLWGMYRLRVPDDAEQADESWVLCSAVSVNLVCAKTAWNPQPGAIPVSALMIMQRLPTR